MNFELIDCLFHFNTEPVTLVARNALGGLTNIETTQTALNARRPSPSQPWGDNEAKAVAEERLPEMLPDVANITVSLRQAIA